MAHRCIFYLGIYSKKRIANKNKRILVTWIATIIVSFVIIVSFFTAVFFSIEGYENYPIRKFDKNGWRSNRDTRYEYSKDIIDSKILIGKTKAQVCELLGDDGNLDKDDSWCYRLGFVPEIGNIDPDVMCIEFKNGKVVSVDQHNT